MKLSLSVIIVALVAGIGKPRNFQRRKWRPQPTTYFWLLGRGASLIGTGLAVGIAATIAFSRAISGLLYGVTANDPATLVAVIAVLAGVAILASYLPARRAARVDPLVALRYE